ncbi:uncharacterized protein VTP21DRAFT_9707 [Calcarisporiella thermophila]|uniref:uncharacterized protein n=1 Tax=Calcarisporiella thermophila TaxID=911321 RepID=UPI0037420209
MHAPTTPIVPALLRGRARTLGCNFSFWYHLLLCQLQQLGPRRQTGLDEQLCCMGYNECLHSDYRANVAIMIMAIKNYDQHHDHPVIPSPIHSAGPTLASRQKRCNLLVLPKQRCHLISLSPSPPPPQAVSLHSSCP